MQKPWISLLAAVSLGLPAVATAQPLQADRNWAQFTQALQRAGEQVTAKVPKGMTSQDLADLDILKLGAVMSGYLLLVQGDVDHPSFIPRLGLYENILVPNTDTRYLATVVDGHGVYRLRGDRGNVPILGLAVRGAYKPDPRQTVHSFKDYDFDQLTLDRDGRFDVILSAERPKGYTGDWWFMDPAAETLSLRVVSDDWGKQIDPRVTIQRVDIPARKTRPSAAEIQRKIALLPDYVSYVIGVWLKHAEVLEQDGFVNKIKEMDYKDSGGLTGQRYYEGVYDFGPDEALILETDMPRTCRYWSILLSDVLGGSLDWSNNQTSLNRSSARLDRDGRLRVVLAHTDPGVPNWLDTADHPKGVIQGRWTYCDSAPIPTVTKVKLADVRRLLPPDTPRVSPAQRDEVLHLRREADQLRRQW